MSRDYVKVAVNGMDAAVKQTLTLYHEDVNGTLRTLAEKAVIDLYDETKTTAPKNQGRFRRAIAWRENIQKNSLYGASYLWYVKAPYYRLTHLIVNGHLTRDGVTRTRGNSFLATATNRVLAEFEQNIGRALNGH